MYLLGISAYYHDSAVCLLHNGQIVAAVQEERFSRRKHDARFPERALAFCLERAGIDLEDVAGIAFYEKPLLTFERLLETYYENAPRGFRSFVRAMPVWLKEKLFFRQTLKRSLRQFQPRGKLPPLYFPEHHLSHAASAFYPSPFKRAAYLTLDGVGEWATTTYGLASGAELQKMGQLDFPHSLGLLYSAFTYYCGFTVNSGEYKLMGLAPYGEPRYVDEIRDHLIDLKADGSFRLNRKYFGYETSLRMVNTRFERLFGGPPRRPESELTQRIADLAASVQRVTESAVLGIARRVQETTGAQNLVMAGGVALNCVANGKLRRAGLFDKIWVQPAAGDAGGALGAALATWYIGLGRDRSLAFPDAQQASALGPEVADWEVEALFARYGAVADRYENRAALCRETAQRLAAGEVGGWVQGRAEYGPRALGNRSILADARSPQHQQNLNVRIKFRESFRPFAPAVLAEYARDWFELEGESPYMLFTAPVRASRRKSLSPAEATATGLARGKLALSEIPAVTHVDFSARVQTVDATRNPVFYQLLRAFYAETDCPVLVNTSFNTRGEPIVNSAEDAYRCFMRTGLDFLVINGFLFEKSAQPEADFARWEVDLVTD